MNQKFSKDEEVIANQQIDAMFEYISKQIQYLDPVSFKIGAKQSMLVCDKAMEVVIEDYEKRIRDLESQLKNQLTLVCA